MNPKTYSISWRGPYIPGRVASVIRGVSRYPTQQAAWDQVAKYRAVWPGNRYYVE